MNNINFRFTREKQQPPIIVARQMVRTRVSDIRETGRNTQGVKLIELESADKLKAIAPVISEKGSVKNGP